MSWRPRLTKPPEWFCTVCELSMSATLQSSHEDEHRLEDEMMGVLPVQDAASASSGGVHETYTSIVDVSFPTGHQLSGAHQQRIGNSMESTKILQEMYNDSFEPLRPMGNESTDVIHLDAQGTEESEVRIVNGRDRKEEEVLNITEEDQENDGGEGEAKGDDEVQDEEEEDEDEADEDEDEDEVEMEGRESELYEKEANQEEEKIKEERKKGVDEKGRNEDNETLRTPSEYEEQNAHTEFIPCIATLSLPLNPPSVHTGSTASNLPDVDLNSLTTPSTLLCTICDFIFPSKSRHFRLATAQLCSLCETWIHNDCCTLELPASTSSTPSDRFYCVVCRRSCPTEFRELHSSEEWECTVCQRTMHLATKDAHLRGSQHWIKEREATVAVVAEQPATPAKPPDSFHCAVCAKNIPVLYLDDHLSAAWECTVCERTMHDAVKDAHLQGATHRGVEELRKQVGEKVVEDEETESDGGGQLFFCPICKKECPVKFLDEHITPVWECTICERTMHMAVREKHLIGGQHRGMQMRKKRYTEVVEEAGSEVLRESGRFYCEVCDKTCPAEYREAHESEAWRCEVCDRTMHLVRKEQHLVGKRHRAMEFSKQHQDGTLDSRWNEGEVVPTSTIAHTSLSGVYQQSNHTAAGTNPSVGKEPETTSQQAQETFHCQVCAKDYPLDYLDTHISPGWECALCERTMHIAVREAHLQGSPHLKKQRESLRHATGTAVEEVINSQPRDTKTFLKQTTAVAEPGAHVLQKWECTVCERAMFPWQKEVHLNGVKHQQQVKIHQRDAQATSPQPSVSHPERCIEASIRSPAKLHQDHHSPNVSSTWECKLCETVMQVAQKEIHLKGIRHRTQAQQRGESNSLGVVNAPALNIRPPVETENQSPARRNSNTVSGNILPRWECTVCETTMQAAQREIHLKGNRHKLQEQQKHSEPEGGAGAALLRVQRLLSDLNRPTTELHKQPRSINILPMWTCTICETTMQATQKEIHLKGNRHRLQEQAIASTSHSPGSASITAVNNNHFIPNDDNATEVVSIRARWDCTVCLRTMNISHKESHLLGARHREQELKQIQAQGSGTSASTLQVQKVVAARSKPSSEIAAGPPNNMLRWECTVCERTMHAKHKEQHLLGSAHRLELQQRRDDGREQGSEKIADATVYDEKRVAVNELTGSGLAKLTWDCKVCECSMQASQKAAHLQGTRHKMQVQLKQPGVECITPTPMTKLLDTVDDSANEDRKLDADKAPTTADTFYCQVCARDCPLAYLEAHITPSWHCGVCERNMHGGVRETHLLSGPHRKKERKKRLEGGTSRGNLIRDEDLLVDAETVDAVPEELLLIMDE